VSELPVTPESLIGQLLDGRYKIVREIAVGGMSAVFEALHVKIGRTVAIKVLNRDMASDPEAVARFINEARAVGTFGHPNIVASTDFGELPGHVPYLVLEYLNGHTLADEIAEQGPFQVRRVVRVAIQIASALDAAHARGVVHRDLTSDNIFLTTQDGKPDHVKVLDFGISKFLSTTDFSPKTRRGLTMGTPEFMAPEQISDPQSVDARVDIYALGVIMYQMLAGQTPFGRLPLQTLLTQIVVEPPPPIERFDVPDGVRKIVARALAKNPAERFANMREMGIEIEQFSSMVFPSESFSGRVGTPVLGLVTRSWSQPVASDLSGAPTSPGATSTTSRVRVPMDTGVTVPSNVAPPTTVAIEKSGSRGWKFAAIGIAIAALAGLVLLRRGGDVLEGQRPGPATIAVPAPGALPANPGNPAMIRVQVGSPTQQSRVTLRGRTHPVPFDADLKTGSEPEVVEITAPGREGRRFWLKLDHSMRLAADLPVGRGVLEVSAEETLVALGERPVPVEGAAGKSPEPQRASTSHHAIRSHVASAGKGVGAAPAPVNPVPPPSVPAPASATATPPAPPPKAESIASPSTPTGGTPKAEPPPRPVPQRAVVASQPGPASTLAVPTIPRAGGTLDPARVQAVVKSRLPEIRRCYERGKMDEPDLKGRVTVKISVSGTGAVSSSTIETSTLGNSRVETCIADAVQGWRFPAPSGGTSAVISYPFNLH
jgi:TonB family protein